MAKYFDYDLVKSEDIMDFFASVERKAYGFFRVVLTPEKMVYFDKYNNKFPLSMAIIVYMDAKGTMRQALFYKQNLNYSFQAAGKQDDCLVFSLNTETLIEKNFCLAELSGFLLFLRLKLLLFLLAMTEAMRCSVPPFVKDTVISLPWQICFR